MARLNLRRIYRRRWMSSHLGPSTRVCWGLMAVSIVGAGGLRGRLDVPADLGPATAIALGSTVPAHLADGTTRCWGTNTTVSTARSRLLWIRHQRARYLFNLASEDVPWGYTITGEYQFERICPEGQFYRSVLKENARPSDLREFRCVVDENLPLGPRADGTYVDDRGLMWMRCAQGMTWDTGFKVVRECRDVRILPRVL